MPLYMLDTDTVMEVIRGKTPALDERIAAARPAELCLSAVTRGELLCGLQWEEGRAGPSDGSMSERDALERWRSSRRHHLDQATIESLRKTTHASLAMLTPEEAKALRKRFGIKITTPPTLEEIDRQFELARERTRQGWAAQRLSDVVHEFLARVTCLSWDEAAATHFATAAAQLQRGGRTSGSMDLMIAGHALAVGAILVTTRESQFEGVEGLRVEDWTESQ